MQAFLNGLLVSLGVFMITASQMYFDHSGAVDSYFNRVAQNYEAASTRWPWSWLRRREANSVFELLDDIADTRCLDLGCGSGYYTRRLIDLGACQITAIDSAANMIAALPKDDVVTPLLCDAAVLSDVGPFDRIITAGLLEFVQCPNTVLSNVRKVLVRSGSLVLLAPANNLWGRFYARWHANHGINVHLFNLQKLEELAAKSGWHLTDYRQVWPFAIAARFRPNK